MEQFIKQYENSQRHSVCPKFGFFRKVKVFRNTKDDGGESLLSCSGRFAATEII